ncbi:DUF742 domain-containing protein [Amycolatopsis magusensis]|uniref:DUF742 domain-containing protein n=1 Tax=Amycolatopsis magusensis TaxID=882444 RepID=UPI003788BA56
MNGHDDLVARPVPLHMVIGGHGSPRLTAWRPETVFVARPGAALADSTSPERRSIVGLCRHPLAAVEIAAHTRLPTSVVLVLASDLVDGGVLSVRTAARTDGPSTDLLERVLDGLLKL